MASLPRRTKPPKAGSRFDTLGERAREVDDVTSTTKTTGEAASTAPSRNTLTAPAKNQRARFQMRMLQEHKLVFEAHQYKVWTQTGRGPSLQKLLDEATAIMAFVLSEDSGITPEASLIGESLSDCVIRHLTTKPKKTTGRK